MGQLAKLWPRRCRGQSYPLDLLEENARGGDTVSLLILLRDLLSTSFLAQSY
jgi:hypothetical protein